jgi:diguanylate cyclase (GGDEF)-like protein/PAS domain S-box-containing protein
MNLLSFFRRWTGSACAAAPANPVGLEEQARQLEESFRLLFEANPAPMWVFDEKTLRFLAVNNAAVEHYGYSRERFLAMSLLDIRPREDWDALRLDVETGGPGRGERTWRHIRADGSEIEVAAYGSVLSYHGRRARIAVIFDLTERKLAEQRIAHLARHDSLTDLPNRSAFNQHLARTIEDAVTTHAAFALMFVDLDRFKEINDVFGHSVGDGVLREVARRFAAAAEGAFLARLGGDEFILIVAGGTGPASAVADRLVAALATDIVIEERHLSVGTSVGVAVYPADGTDTSTLLGNADAALYRAKAAGRGSIRFFAADMDMHLRERRILQSELKTAVARGQLVLHYQPQARVDGRTTGFEALVRWNHPGRGMIPPGLFIPIAEESGIIIAIGEWVLREACREAATWSMPLRVAVNISPVQFRRGDLTGMVHSALLETGLAPARLELEVTESVLIDDSSRALSILRRLKSLGVRIAMDDFGTGYSSLSYLQSFPFDKIKIDRTFISKVERNPQSAAIVRGVIGLARGLNMPIVGEGVETGEQLAFLSNEACDEVQGYLIGRPAPIEVYGNLVGQVVSRKQASSARA